MQLRRMYKSEIRRFSSLLEISHKRVPGPSKPVSHLTLEQRPDFDGVSAELGTQTSLAHRERVQGRLREALAAVSRVRKCAASRDSDISRARDHSQP